MKSPEYALGPSALVAAAERPPLTIALAATGLLTLPEYSRAPWALAAVTRRHRLMAPSTAAGLASQIAHTRHELS